MTNEKSELWGFIQGFCENVSLGFNNRWAQVTPDTYNKFTHHALGGLLARQSTLSIELAKAPMSWNGHIAPLTLRSMVDAYITISWKLEDIEKRAKQYIEYGLGQEKLFIEHLEHSSKEEPDGFSTEQIEKMIEYKKEWLNAQQAEWAVNVNVGSWSGMSTRSMAKEIGRESIYKFSYVPFSAVTHNMWQHVGLYNIAPCSEPLHNGHLVPQITEYPPEPDFLYRAAKYISMTFDLIDEKMDIKTETPSPVEFMLNHEFICNEDSEE